MNFSEQPLIINEEAYSLEVLKRAVYNNLTNASFLICIQSKGIFRVEIQRKNEKFRLTDFLDDLNYYNFIDSENQNSVPIFDSILEKMKSGFDTK